MYEVLTGHTIANIAGLPPSSVHAVITSPPYWGLRDYGLEGVDWADGWHGCLGLEPTPDLYVAHLVEVFSAVARVLRPDGTLWLNLGDSYAANRTYQVPSTKGGPKHSPAQGFDGSAMTVPPGLKSKDLVGIPWRVAFALQAAGWYLRAAIPWVKRNCMPSSTRDRPTTGIEYVFLFAHPESKGRYFYDVEAVKVVASGKPQRRKQAHMKRVSGAARPPGTPPHRLDPACQRDEPATDAPGGRRQRRDTDWFFDSLRGILDGGEGLLHPEADEDDAPSGTVSAAHPVPLALVVNPRPFKAAHFAVFPPTLVEPMIKAATSERGVCPGCGAPWVRLVERTRTEFRPSARQEEKRAAGSPTTLCGTMVTPPSAITVGWQPSCTCPAADPVPAVVLDPFGGSGTTSVVSIDLGRNSIYSEASTEYADTIARPRLAAALREAALRSLSEED